MPSDYDLGRNLANHLNNESARSDQLITALLQDLMGADQTLLAPLRDLIARPAFKQIMDNKNHVVTVVTLDSLLSTLDQTYRPEIVIRLSDFLDGFFDIEPPTANDNIRESEYEGFDDHEPPYQARSWQEENPMTDSNIQESEYMEFDEPQIADEASSIYEASIDNDQGGSFRGNLDSGFSSNKQIAYTYDADLSSKIASMLARCANQLSRDLFRAIVFLVLIGFVSLFALWFFDHSDSDQPEALDMPQVSLQKRLPIPLTDDQPSDAELQNLLQVWHDSKAVVLAGGESPSLAVVASDPLVQRVYQERDNDAAQGETHKIEASISSLEVINRSPQRIELKALVAYRDQKLDADERLLTSTPQMNLPVTYILGRDGDSWRLHAYRSDG